MYMKTDWIDHVVSPQHTIRLTDNGDGTYYVEEVGTIIQQGTNMNAVNFNNMENGILAGYLTAVEAARYLECAQNHLTDHDTHLSTLDTSFEDLTKDVYFINNTLHEAVLTTKKALDMAEALKSFVLTVTLTNTQKYPFNNSVQTVPLGNGNLRNSKDYTLIVEIMSYSGGCVGDIVITDKMLNGFKIAHTGSAATVNLKIYVQGGI